MRLIIPALAAMLAASPALAAPKVIASVVPVHSIVSAVMGDLGQPELLLKGSMSEHRANFTPSQVSDLGKADLVFIVGHGLEAKLAQIGGSEAVNGKSFVELSEAPGVKTLPIREGGTWEAHDEAHEDEKEEAGHGHDHEREEAGHDGHAEGVLAFDPHVWLDPENAKAMAAAVAAELAKADPANAAAYQANAKAFEASLDAVTAEISAELAPVKTKPYIVFHDAYQYFEARFGLSAAGSISDVSAKAPSAQRLEEIRNKLKATQAECVFREPQYDSKVVATVIEGTPAREGVLDPLGADVAPGAGAYRQILLNLAASLKACLSA
ncbi:zinc ABC transporter substrate-binding protein [Aestuariivirga sp.]|uniref:zinc ABC transporter substrate-binding protein n=1 Tax=Aestuariivirga sp. TaxID=2650926 RepID=UPI0035937FE3